VGTSADSIADIIGNYNGDNICPRAPEAASALSASAGRAPPKSQPELEGNRIVLNATKQAPAPQASKILGRASQPKEAWK
jgi:hypothetical protein